LTVARDRTSIDRKKAKVRKFMVYAIQCGALEPVA
jgi:hypothetical protein